SGNTLTVTCGGRINDARYYFPDPRNFYGLVNADCKSTGVRGADGVNGGCFDIQIEGACGIQQVAAVNATSITLAGAGCAWASGGTWASDLQGVIGAGVDQFTITDAFRLPRDASRRDRYAYRGRAVGLDLSSFSGAQSATFRLQFGSVCFTTALRCRSIGTAA